MNSCSWCLLNEVFWSLFVFFLFIYVYSLFDIINLATMSIIICCFELGGVCGGVCVWVHVCLDVGLGSEGPGLGLLFFLCCLWVGVGICLEKCPVIWDVLFYCTCSPFCIVLLVPLVVWLVKYLDWAFVAAAAFLHLVLVLCNIHFYLYKWCISRPFHIH